MATYEGSIDSPWQGGYDRLAPIGKDIVVDTKAAGDNHWQLLEVDGAMISYVVGRSKGRRMSSYTSYKE